MPVLVARCASHMYMYKLKFKNVAILTSKPKSYMYMKIQKGSSSTTNPNLREAIPVPSLGHSYIVYNDIPVQKAEPLGCLVLRTRFKSYFVLWKLSLPHLSGSWTWAVVYMAIIYTIPGHLTHIIYVQYHSTTKHSK